MAWTGHQVRDAMGGVLRSGGEQLCTGVSTDTRTLQSGDLFIALRGAHFDGHAFIDAALERGCCGCVVEAGVAIEKFLDERVLVEVVNTLTALGDLASAYLRKLDTTVIGVTGSNGKTSTKDMIATVLGAYASVTSNYGNFNNRIGLPLSALQVQASHRYAVFEMGMNEPGEIEQLADIAEPKVALITSISAAHLEGLGSVDAIRETKAALYRGLGPDDVAVVNGRDPHVMRAAEGIAARKIVVGEDDADVRVEGIRRIGVGALEATIRIGDRSMPLRIRGIGQHNIWNAALAVGVAVALDLDPLLGIEALASHQGPKGRLEWAPILDGPNILDDTYNANPESSRAALRTLVELCDTQTSVAVLGDMLELGESAEQLHEEIGQFAADVGVDVLLAMGKYAQQTVQGFGPGGEVVSDHAVAVNRVLDSVGQGDWVLVKGSRSMRMEQVVSSLQTSYAHGGR
jgi:UDP-N-acetylmuramoyl-tripeptide--D-alanyl-D-alanine ligase